jgi:serine/threonine protein kinase
MFGGKVLGEGGFGCVVYPHYPCKNKKTDIELVSKIVSADPISYKEIADELNISLKLKKIDPKNTYFLGGIEKCYIKQKNMKEEDIKGCDRIKNQKRFINILIPKGEEFEIIMKDMNIDSIYKTIKHLVKGIKLLNLKNLLFLDIKPENLLFVRNKNNPDDIHPVFIDFGKDYVIKSKSGLNNFIKGLAGQFYYPLAPELNVVLYLKGLKYNKYTFNSYLDDLRQGRMRIKRYYKINPDGKEVDEMKNNFNKELEKNYKLTTQKLMIYSVGLSILSVLQIYHPKELMENIKLRTILSMMTDIDIRERGTCDEIIKIIDNILPNNIKRNISIEENSKLKNKKIFKTLTPLQREQQKTPKKGLKKLFSFFS